LESCIDVALSKFVEIKYVECLNILLKFTTTENIKNLFDYAHCNKNYDVCKFLINYVGIDDTKYDGKVIKYYFSNIVISEIDHSRALYLSCKYNKYKNMKHILCTYDIDINYVEDGKTCLDYAIIRNNTKMVKYLLEFGANYNSHPKIHNTSDKIFKLLLKYEKYNISEQDILHLVKFGKIKSLKFLLKNGRINNKEELLKIAIYDGNYETTKLLLDFGAKVENNIKYALELNHYEIMFMLCKYTNKHTEDDLYAVCDKYSEYDNIHFDIIKYLIENGVKITNKCFQRACKYYHTKLVKFLIDNGADINEKDGDGMTPLMNALKNQRMMTYRLLLEAGAKKDLMTTIASYLL